MTNENTTIFASVPYRPFTRKLLLLVSLSILFGGSFLLFSSDSRIAYKHHTISMTIDDREGRTESESIRTTSGTTDCAVKTVEHGCYIIRQDMPPKFILMNSSELARLGCAKREPSAIIIGTKKSGTTTLKNFLGYHPDIAFAERELKFVNHNPLVELDDYRALMPYATPSQVPMEKTPGYFIRLVTAKRLQLRMPDTKFIVILRDPVKRAISDFVHMRYVDCKREGGATLIHRGRVKQMVPRYEVEDSFSKSVLFPNGTIKEYNSLIDSGLYVKYFRQWLRYFPPEQFLIVDGESFVRHPAPVMREVEDFLGVGRYFSEDHFYYDESKRFYCLKKPLNTCMSPNKGRPHPDINDRVIAKLTRYYKPHNKELELLLNRTFSWS